MLRYKNFLSSGDQFTEIELNKHSCTLVVGRSGHGKSTMNDAIFFALFNKPYRNINKPNLVNSVNGSGLLTELEFTIKRKSYKIVRGIKPNIFEIYEDDKLVSQDAANKDYQKHLEDNILGGLNDKIFKQVVILSATDYQPFMTLRAWQRREIIEELLDIKIFSYMTEVLKGVTSSIKESLREYDYKISLCEERIKLLNRQVKKAKEDSLDKISKLRLKLSSYEDPRKTSCDRLEELKKLLETNSTKHSAGVNILEKSLQEMKHLLSSLKTAQNSNKKTVDLINNNSNCPTCYQSITDDFKKEFGTTLDNKILDISAGIEKLSTEITRKQKNLKDFDKIAKVIQTTQKKISDETYNIKLIDNSCEQIKSDIENLESIKVDSETQQELLTNVSQFKEFKKDRDEVIHHQDYYGVIATMLKDSGIKSKIIQQYIPIMNQIINKYLNQFGLPIEFTLDEEFNEVIRSRFRDSFQYNNFSEGEKTRIDIALMLAWRDIAKMKNTTATNLLFFDEMDAKLDPDSSEELINMIKCQDVNTNVFMISHKGQLVDKMDNCIMFEKIGNFSIMSEE